MLIKSACRLFSTLVASNVALAGTDQKHRLIAASVLRYADVLSPTKYLVSKRGCASSLHRWVYERAGIVGSREQDLEELCE